MLEREAALSMAPPAPRASRRAEVIPIDADTFSLRATLDAACKADLDRLVELMSHTTGRDLGGVLHEAIRCALERHGKRRGAVAPERPRARPGAPSAPANQPMDLRAIPAHVRREVWARDGGACAYVSPDGRRCGSRWRLELHHLQAAAKGGPPTAANISLRCKPHNIFEAELEFGREHMAEFLRPGGGDREAGRPSPSGDAARRSDAAEGGIAGGTGRSADASRQADAAAGIASGTGRSGAEAGRADAAGGTGPAGAGETSSASGPDGGAAPRAERIAIAGDS